MLKLSQSDKTSLKVLAEKYTIPFAALCAVIEVESNGQIFAKVGNENLPVIRYEGHYFDRLCKASVRNIARQAGVSSPTAGKIKNPASQADRWKLVDKAAEYDKQAAYESCSYGVGQVMGANWKDLGYPNVMALVREAKNGLIGQAELMLKFIKFNHLDTPLRNLDWSAFARGYNGSNYRKNKYDTKLEAAYISNGGKGKILSSRVGLLRLGSTGAGVREVQSLLVAAGYAIKVDGDFGQATQDAVKVFQSENKLVPDGIVGEKTQQALSKYRNFSSNAAGSQSISSIPEVKTGVITAAGVPTVLITAKEELTSLIDKVSPVGKFEAVGNFVNLAIGIITVGIVVYGVYRIYSGWKKSKQSYTGTGA